MTRVCYTFDQEVVHTYKAEMDVPDDVVSRGTNAVVEHLASNDPEHEELAHVSYGRYIGDSFEIDSVEEETHR